MAVVDVAIVDLGLPDGYGADFIKELREKNPQTQALVLSASLDRAEVARAVEAGAGGGLAQVGRYGRGGGRGAAPEGGRDADVAGGSRRAAGLCRVP